MTFALPALPRYDASGEVNVRGFAGSMGVYAVACVAAAATARSSGRAPDAYDVADLVLGGVATHKLSRLLAKGAVTSAVRAPFTEFVRPAGSSEHVDRIRGDHGFRRTVGELLSCPFCLDVWIATAYVAGLVLAPRATRAWAAVFSVIAISDFLQQAYGRVRED
jgi:hypothetical protein